MANVTKQLRVGQKVNVTELESGCRLAVVDDDASALTITETAFDYLVLEDAAGEVKTRLPTYLVRGVTVPEGAAALLEAPVPVAVPEEAPLAVEDVSIAVEAVSPTVETPVSEEVPMSLVSEAA